MNLFFLFMTLSDWRTDERPVYRSIIRCKNELLRDDVLCLRTFLPLGHFHRDLLSFFKGFESFHLDGRVMHENILAALALDKTKPFVIIEPFNGSFNSFA